jgi:hypothetical protein
LFLLKQTFSTSRFGHFVDWRNRVLSPPSRHHTHMPLQFPFRLFRLALYPLRLGLSEFIPQPIPPYQNFTFVQNCVSLNLEVFEVSMHIHLCKTELVLGTHTRTTPYSLNKVNRFFNFLSMPLYSNFISNSKLPPSLYNRSCGVDLVDRCY